MCHGGDISAGFSPGLESPGGNTGSSSFYAGAFYFFSYRWNVHDIFRTDSGVVAAGHAVFL